MYVPARLLASGLRLTDKPVSVLSALFTASLIHLTESIRTLTDAVQDETKTPAERLILLKEVAEFAQRFKLGGEDKIRVVGGVCEGVSSCLRADGVLGSRVARNESRHGLADGRLLVSSAGHLAPEPPSLSPQPLDAPSGSRVHSSRRLELSPSDPSRQANAGSGRS